MSREPEQPPNALNHALEEFLSAHSVPAAKPAPAPGAKPASAARPAAGGAAKLPPNAGHRPSRPTEAPSLRQAYDKVLEDDAAKKVVRPEAPPTLLKRLRGPLVLLVVSAATAYVWFGEPAWLREPEHVSLRVPQTGVTARRQMAAIALEIDDYHRNTGRLPGSLSDLGLNLSHVRYVKLADGRFELSIGSGPHTARYRGSINGVDSLEGH